MKRWRVHDVTFALSSTLQVLLTMTEEDHRQPKQLSLAQWRFVKHVRGAIKKDHIAFFKANDWRNIAPKSGSYDSHLLNPNNKNTTGVDSFYVKAMACWVPHLLIRNHIPTCPRCSSKEFVDPIRSRFINSPIVLYGMSTNRYLDTCLYPCNKCEKSFSGYNKQSMQLDATVYFAYFNFYLGPGYAVDEQLYRNIVEEAATESTAMIARRLKTYAYTRYYSDYQLYLHAVSVKCISQPNKKQKTIRQLFPKRSTDPVLEQLRRNKREALDAVGRARASINEATKESEKDLPFNGIMGDKDNHNIHGRFNVLAGLGSTKLRRLMQAHIFSMHELLAAHDNDTSVIEAGLQHLLPLWQEKVLLHYNGLKFECNKQKAALNNAKEFLALATSELDAYTETHLRPQEGSLTNPYRCRRLADSTPLLKSSPRSVVKRDTTGECSVNIVGSTASSPVFLMRGSSFRRQR
jgi:hypothetical protein